MRQDYRPARPAARMSGFTQFFVSGLAMAVLVSVGLALASCSSYRDPFAGTPSPMYKGSGPLPKGGGRYHVGEPYQVAGKRYHPREEPDYDRVGIASWYGPSFHRRMTSNGEWFDQDYLSAAHPTLPLPSYARVTNLETGRQLVVRVNDRGPFVDNRIIDLSKKSADALGFRGRGTAKVRVQYLGRAPLNDQGTHLAAMNRSLDRGVPSRAVALAAKPKPEPERQESPVVMAASQVAGFYVQVGSFSDPSNAGRAKANVAAVGPVVITPVEADLGRFYRVQVGPLHEAEAHAALAQVQAAGHHDAKLVLAQN